MDEFPTILKKTIEALKRHVQKKGCWPSQKEWNRHASRYLYYSAETLYYLNLWTELQYELKSSKRKGKTEELFVLEPRDCRLLNCRNFDLHRESSIWIKLNETNLRKSRKALGWSIEHLAGQVGLTKKRLGQIELRMSKAKNIEVELLAKVLKADVKFIKEGLLVGYERSVMYVNKK